jgi:hypothetical protein
MSHIFAHFASAGAAACVVFIAKFTTKQYFIIHMFNVFFCCIVPNALLSLFTYIVDIPVQYTTYMCGALAIIDIFYQTRPATPRSTIQSAFVPTCAHLAAHTVRWACSHHDTEWPRVIFLCLAWLALRSSRRHVVGWTAMVFVIIALPAWKQNTPESDVPRAVFCVLILVDCLTASFAVSDQTAAETYTHLLDTFPATPEYDHICYGGTDREITLQLPTMEHMNAAGSVQFVLTRKRMPSIVPLLDVTVVDQMSVQWRPAELCQDEDTTVVRVADIQHITSSTDRHPLCTWKYCDVEDIPCRECMARWNLQYLYPTKGSVDIMLRDVATKMRTVNERHRATLLRRERKAARSASVERAGYVVGV